MTCSTSPKAWPSSSTVDLGTSSPSTNGLISNGICFAAADELLTVRLGWGLVAEPCRLAVLMGRVLQSSGWAGQVSAVLTAENVENPRHQVPGIFRR